MTNQPRSGSSLVVDALQEQGVELVFAITGAGNLALLDEIKQRGTIQVVFMHHEQATVMAAQGYSRTSGKIGVAIVTTGGGTTNAMTGILSAHLDSIPVLVISGNESSFHCLPSQGLRGWGVQGFDSVSTFAPITKKSLRLSQGICPAVAVTELMHQSLMNRKGPTHVDFPMDLQRSSCCPPGCLHLSDNHEKTLINQKGINFNELVSALENAERPLVYIGNGCRDTESFEHLARFLHITKIPFVLSWSAVDLFPETHPQNIGRGGIYGERATNLSLQRADLLICLGTRLAIPQVGYDKNDFARNASIWVVEIDPNEIRKFPNNRWNLLEADVGLVLEKLNQLLSETEYVNTSVIEKWRLDCKNLREEFPRTSDMQVGARNPKFVHSVDVIDYLSDCLDDRAVIVTDVGAGLLSGHYAYRHKMGRRFFTSQGLGEMGFGLPAAIGAFFSDKTRQIVCLNTDGGIMFNLQELQTISYWKIPMKLFIFNNDGYTMIKVSQANLFEGREFGSSTISGVSFPKFKDLAESFDMNYFRIQDVNDLNSHLTEELKAERSTLFEVIMDPHQRYLPRLGTTRLLDGTLVSPPLEDLDPKISLSALSQVLEGGVHEASRTSRQP